MTHPVRPPSHRTVPQPESAAGAQRGLGSALAIPLFWKIVWVNVVLMAVVAAVTALAVSGAGATDGTVAALLLAMFAVAAGINGWIVNLALRPIADLTDTAEQVRLGDSRARVPASVLADPKLEHLRIVLNDLFDAVDLEKERRKEASHQVVLGQERTRQRMAHELYASTAQTLAGVLVRLKVVLRHCEGELDRDHLEGLGNEVRLALEQVRGFARRLSPPELAELGVRAALDAHVRGLQEDDPEAPRIVVEGRLVEERLAPEARLALYRVVEEALTNAVRHADASEVRVYFSEEPAGIRAEVEDDGKGFSLDDPNLGGGLGLLTMMERAGYAQGQTTVDTLPGRGTRIDLRLPWSDPLDARSNGSGNGAGSPAAVTVTTI